MRLGRFKVTAEFYRNNELMIAMQKGMAILNVRIEHSYFNQYEFMAVGEMFDDVPEYEVIPEYSVFIDSDINFTFKRID